MAPLLITITFQVLGLTTALVVCYGIGGALLRFTKRVPGHASERVALSLILGIFGVAVLAAALHAGTTSIVALAALPAAIALFEAAPSHQSWKFDWDQFACLLAASLSFQAVLLIGRLDPRDRVMSGLLMPHPDDSVHVRFSQWMCATGEETLVPGETLMGLPAQHSPYHFLEHWVAVGLHHLLGMSIPELLPSVLHPLLAASVFAVTVALLRHTGWRAPWTWAIAFAVPLVRGSVPHALAGISVLREMAVLSFAPATILAPKQMIAFLGFVVATRLALMKRIVAAAAVMLAVGYVDGLVFPAAFAFSVYVLIFHWKQRGWVLFAPLAAYFIFFLTGPSGEHSVGGSAAALLQTEWMATRARIVVKDLLQISVFYAPLGLLLWRTRRTTYLPLCLVLLSALGHAGLAPHPLALEFFIFVAPSALSLDLLLAIRHENRSGRFGAGLVVCAGVLGLAGLMSEGWTRRTDALSSHPSRYTDRYSRNYLAELRTAQLGSLGGFYHDPETEEGNWDEGMPVVTRVPVTYVVGAQLSALNITAAITPLAADRSKISFGLTPLMRLIPFQLARVGDIVCGLPLTFVIVTARGVPAPCLVERATRSIMDSKTGERVLLLRPVEHK